jgi:hypothetical protein
VSDDERSFLKRLAQRNWLVLGATALLSLLYGSTQFTAGVVAGGLLAIAGFWWQERALQRILAHPSPQAARGFQVRYFLRLAILGLLLYVLIARIGMHPVGLALGLSVVVINIFCTAIARAMRDRT